MILCDSNCIPCCDFCIYVRHGTIDIEGTNGPVGCDLHTDKLYQMIAEDCGHCNDFHCFRAKEK